MDRTTIDPAAVSATRAAAWGGLTAGLAVGAPLLLQAAGHGWLARVFGGAAPAHVLVGGGLGALLAGLTVGVVLASLRASQATFLGAWVGTTLVRLAGLGVLVVTPVAGAGATQGLLIGYVAAVVSGSVIEVPSVLVAGRSAGRPADRAPAAVRA